MVLGAPSTSFIGRVSEMKLVGELLEQTRLLTIMGTAGSGKTRLVYETSQRLSARFPGGIFVCELAPLTNGNRLAAAIAAVFDIGSDPGDHFAEVVAQKIGERPALLVLDNCEHLRVDVADLIVRLLASTPALSILATSRERLRVAGETAWPIPPMSLPDNSGALERSDAATLLLERVRAMDPGYAVSGEASMAVAQICARLEGLPLALELAASRLVIVPPAQLLTMLDDALAVLAGGERSSRQQTLRAALDWSYDLLTDESRSDFRRLSVFAGPFSLSAAAAVMELKETVALDRLATLRDCSLIAADTRGAIASFRLLEPVRQYADERLRGSTDERIARRLHASWVLALLDDLTVRVLGRGQLAAVRTFRELLPDFRRAFTWSLRHQPEWAARMAAATDLLWDMVGQLAEGEATMRAALEVGPTGMELARIHFGLTHLAGRRGDPRTLEYAQRAVQSARAWAGGAELGHALVMLGYALAEDGQSDLSSAAFDEAAEIADRIGDRLLHAWAEDVRGVGLALAGRLAEARSIWETQIPVLREFGDVHNSAISYSNLAYVCLLQGDNLGARKALLTNLRLFAQHPNWAVNTPALNTAAILAARGGRAREAARLAGACSRLSELFYRRRFESEPHLAVARAHLGAAEFDAAVAEGAALPIAEMYEMARREAERSDPMDHGQLTDRELQVARLVARGQSNKEVAARLRRSERTVESHVQHALRKLNMSSRTELGAWAQKQGLLD